MIDCFMATALQNVLAQEPLPTEPVALIVMTNQIGRANRRTPSPLHAGEQFTSA